MKKLLLLFILLQSVYSHATYVQINFVDNFEIGITNPYTESPSQGTATTDSEINTIFENHFVYHCIEDFSSISKIIFADYTGENLESFINDLQNNNNVSKAKVTLNTREYSLTYADKMYLTLIDISVGKPFDTNSNGNIITNNPSLNTIFDTYNVKQMQLLIPNKPYYTIYFDGDINLLYSALNDLSEIITVRPIGVAMLLSNDKFINSKTSIFPNPFTFTFSITTKEFISEYAVFDISGKQIIKTNSKSELDNQTLNLKTGVYVLELKSVNGEIIPHKIVKK